MSNQGIKRGLCAATATLASLLFCVPVSAKTLQIRLYRAIILVEPHTGSGVEATASLIDFDRYIESGLSAPTKEMIKQPATKIDVTRDGDVVRIGSPSQRELIQLRLKVPAGMSLDIDVTHYAEVYVSGIHGDMKVNAFKGRIDLHDVRQGLLVNLVRDGAIAIDYHGAAARPVVVSVYEGSIRFSLPFETRAEIDARSEEGDVRIDSGPPRSGSAPAFLFRSVKGTIEVMRTRD